MMSKFEIALYVLITGAGLISGCAQIGPNIRHISAVAVSVASDVQRADSALSAAGAY